MPASKKAALVSARPRLGDVKANLQRVLDAARAVEADLIAFPELFLSGYAMRDELRQMAADLHAMDAAGQIRDAARATGKTLVTGLPRPGEIRGTLHNSALIATPDGRVGYHDKVYLPNFSCFEEELFFKEGQQARVFDTPVGRVGLTICYDLFFPEITKAQALQGADLLLCVSASPTPSRRAFETLFAARAVECTSYLLYTNLVGLQDTLTFWGAPQAYGPRGDLKGKADTLEEATLIVDLDLSEVEEARQRRPVLRDTRPEVLRKLLQAGEGSP
ncbi:MAG TPA: carbon-nitrogen hydrolase family protein [Candidatus Thermoplasmatota archaeon]|nr:carbon-nitrogen hydrolase family protein [Candidatus Thermoplasmatota archaeon]